MKISTRATLLATALLATPAFGQNLLTNGNFDAGGLAGWGAFGNAAAQAANPPQFDPRSGTTLVSMFGNFSGGFDVSGIFQTFPASAGQTFTIDCWSRHFSGDALTGSGAPNFNWCVMKIAFFDAGNNEIAGSEGTILDGTSPQDVWIDNAPVSGTAPAGTTSVQALILFLQPMNDGGAGQFDDVEFFGPGGTISYPGTGEDLVLSTGIAGGAATNGAGNDVKMVSGGELIEVNVASPGTTYDGTPYYVLGQAFPTGMPPMPAANLPSVYFDFSQSVSSIVNGGLVGPIGPPVIAPNGGSSTFYSAPAGLMGVSVMLQGVVISPAAANGFYTITDGHELQLQ